jgi:hypothetical protein
MMENKEKESKIIIIRWLTRSQQKKLYLKIKYRIKTREQERDRMMASALIIVITLTQQSSPVCIAMEFFFFNFLSKGRKREGSRVLHILLLPRPPDCLEASPTSFT